MAPRPLAVDVAGGHAAQRMPRRRVQHAPGRRARRRAAGSSSRSPSRARSPCRRSGSACRARRGSSSRPVTASTTMQPPESAAFSFWPALKRPCGGAGRRSSARPAEPASARRRVEAVELARRAAQPARRSPSSDDHERGRGRARRPPRGATALAVGRSIAVGQRRQVERQRRCRAAPRTTRAPSARRAPCARSALAAARPARGRCIRRRTRCERPTQALTS